MTDTIPEVAELVRSKLMSRSGSERFIMGAHMFEAARRLILASLPPDLPPGKLKRQLFERIYGVPAPFKTGRDFEFPVALAEMARAEGTLWPEVGAFAQRSRSGKCTRPSRA